MKLKLSSILHLTSINSVSILSCPSDSAQGSYFQAQALYLYQVTGVIRNAKKTYYSNEISNKRGNSKDMWSILKSILPSNKTTQSYSISSSDFNKYFTNIGNDLTKEFTNEPFSDTDLYADSIFEFNEINVNFVLHELLHLPLKSSHDILTIDCKLLRLSSPIIAPLLAHIFNLSLAQGILPVDLKTALVTPIFKNKGSKDYPGNFRPISVIPTIAKIMEKAVKIQIVNYFTENNFFCKQQSAYLKFHSTSTALHDLVDNWLSNIENGNINITVYLDLTKGFDIVSHEILFSKLAKYGIINTALEWFSSYLSDRTQRVKCNNDISSSLPVSMGVPQGTILGPILFLILVNDFPNCIKNGKCIMYADDTTILCSAKDEIDLKRKINDCMDEALKWFKKNRLLVNINKSNFMIISSKRKVDEISDINVDVNDYCLNKCDETKLLGVMIDSYLSWQPHVEYLYSKIVPKIGLLHRLRQTVTSDILNIIYLSIIQAYFDYCITIWGSCSKTLLCSVQKLQNKAARAVTGNFDFNSSVSDMIKQLGWMNITKRFNYFMLILIYKCLNGQAPSNLSDKLCFVNDTHCYITRSVMNENLAVPFSKGALFHRSFSYNGPKLWNDLPRDIRRNKSIFSFKKQLKEYLMSE